MNGQKFSLIVSCEHAGNEIPPEYLYLFSGSEEVLKTHRAYDPGAIDCARLLSERLNVPLIFQSISRLLIDQNRTLSNRSLFSDFSKALSADKKRDCIDRFYKPYVEKLRDFIEKRIDLENPVLHLSIHSFTPELNGRVRNADIGLLYDPSRGAESQLLSALIDYISTFSRHYRVRRNYPYRGTSDGMVSFFRKVFPPENYIGLEVEFNHKVYFEDKSKYLQMCSSILEFFRVNRKSK